MMESPSYQRNKSKAFITFDREPNYQFKKDLTPTLSVRLLKGQS